MGSDGPTSLEQRVGLFKDLALFRDLPEEELNQIAGRFIDYRLYKGKVLYPSGERAENFYIVFNGSLRSRQDDGEGRVIESVLESGDPFGARALLLDGSEEGTVSALRDSHLLYLPRPDFARMLKQYPQIAERLHYLAAGRQLKGQVDFDWLEKGETVHFVARKHRAYLWVRLSHAMALACAGFLAFTGAIGAPASSQFNWFFGGAILIFGAVAWAIWETLDWRNDYYVLTNMRAVWLEQVLLRSSSRIEAPLANVQSVNTHSSLTGRWMGFGDVVVRTYTGTVLMPSVGNPQYTKALIEEYAARLRKENGQAKHESIRQAVRESLGYKPQNGAPTTVARPLQLIDHTERFQLFKTRTIAGDKIIYHKHWFALFSSLLLPSLFLVAFLFTMRAFYQGWPSSAFGWLLALIFIGIPLGVVMYRYLDWQNDIYMVTPDSLIDSERKPLGSEVTKSAPMANVLSLENHKVGLIGLLLNFGVVRINVGDATLDFDNIHDPAQVQQDIFTRMEALKIKKEQGKADEERQRMTEWLRVYEQERGQSSPPSAGNGQAVE